MPGVARGKKWRFEKKIDKKIIQPTWSNIYKYIHIYISEELYYIHEDPLRLVSTWYSPFSFSLLIKRKSKRWF